RMRFALPHHHEVARAVGGDGGILLGVSDVSVGLELAHQPRTPAVETLPEDAIGVPVLAVIAFPYHHEIARAVGGDCRVSLEIGGEGVDLDLAPGGARPPGPAE